MAQQLHIEEQSPRNHIRFTLTAAGLGLFVAVLFAACSSRISPASPTPSLTATPARSTSPATSTQVASAGATPSPTGAPTSDAAASAVMAVIEKANGEQPLALAQHDPTIMRDTATPAYYSLLVKTEQSMERSGVSAIKLVSLDWGQVSAQGTNAEAATTETWQITSADGSSQQDSARNAYTLVQQGGVWLIASDTQVGSSSIGQSAATGPNQSSNWAGYAATGGPFTAVSGTWTVPQVNANGGSGGADASWIGIGGMTSHDLIQAGTDATVTGAGQVSYSAWVELLPRPSQAVPLTVEPGDVINVSIAQQVTGSWQISIDDQTTGQSYRTTVQYSSSLSSAEWIEEAPSTASARARAVPLDDFGQVRFQNASAQFGGQQVTIADASAQPLTMYDRSGTVATPSALGADGASFTVTRVTNNV
jgi:hypothetical protein